MITGYLLHVGATIVCPHMGQVQVVAANHRVMVSNQPVATKVDTYPIVGCGFFRGDSYSPCVTTQWLVPSARVRVNGQPVILQSSTGLCQNGTQLPQGPPNALMSQVRVKGI